MKWALLIAGGLIALAGLVAAVGSMLPVKHRASRKARYRQTPEALYAVVSGPPDWRKDIKSWGSLPGNKWWEEDGHGQKITYELVEDAPPSRRVVRIAEPSLPFGGTWTVEIAPSSDGNSDVRVTEDGEVYNVIFRFMSRFVFGQTGTIEAFLRDLGSKCGEQPRIES